MKRKITYILRFGAFRYFQKNDSTKNYVTLIHVFKHVFEHRRYIISLSHILKYEYLIKEATQA